MIKDKQARITVAISFARIWSRRDDLDANRKAKAWWFLASAIKDDCPILEEAAELLLLT